MGYYLLTPYVTSVIVAVYVKEFCTCTNTIRAAIKKLNLITFLPSETVCLGLKFLAIYNEKLIIIGYFYFVMVARGTCIATSLNFHNNVAAKISPFF